MKKIVKWFLVLLTIIVVAIVGLLSYVKFALPNLKPAEDLKIEYTPERIERGKYLANSVMICMECHSQRDFSKFAGPAKPGTFGAGGELFGTALGFPGNYYSANLTPYYMKDWTDGELFRAITTGVAKNGRALFPIMPYQRFGLADKEDIYSVIAYIRTLEPIENTVPLSASDFPMNFIINTMPKEATLSAKPDEKDMIAHGKYLLNAASCGECHTQSNKGEPLPGMFLAGGREFKFPDGVVVHSANLTSDKETGIGSWTEEAFLSRFRVFSDSSYVPHDVKDGDFKTVMPWLMFSKMKEEDLKAIFAYLKTVTPVNNKVTKFEKVATQSASN